MATPLLERDLNTFENKSLHVAQRLTKELLQATAVSDTYNQSVHKLHGGRRPDDFHTPLARQTETRDSRGLSKQQEGSSFSSSPAPSPAGPLGMSMLALGVEDMLTHIRRSKLTEGRPVKPSLLSQQQPHHNSTANACLIGEDSGRIKWVQPSGPRRSGEGTEDEEQGIVSAETTASGGAVMRITLLAAGFIIGPSGSSVREISKQTGADIKSWTEKAASAPGRLNRPVRSFVIEGRRRAVVLALDIICDAVDRYKELCEGAYCGQFVARIQRVRGVDFSYQPPPRNIVPYAAALKGQHPRLSRAEDTAPAAPFKRPQPQLQPRAVSTESTSTTSNDCTSDMDDDLSPAAAHKANFQHIHSRADVMKSYLDPFPKPTPYSNPNNPANPNSSRVPFNPPGMTSTPPNQTFDKQYQAGFCTAQPPFAANSPEPVNSWLEHCKLGSKQVQGTSAPAPGHSQGTSKPAPAALAPPAGLVEVRPNVWLPSSAIREAQGDFALAVQIAAQGSNLTSSDIPTDNSYFNMGGLSAGAQFNMKQAQPDGPLLDNPHASIKASYTQDDSKMQFMAGNATSYTPRSNTVSPVSAPVATDAVIEQYAMHNPASKYMTDLQQQHNQQQRNSGGSAASAYCFMSPIVGMPYVDPSNSFISPQCVLDTNSLFSYGLGIGGDTSHQPSNAGWYAKSTSPLYHTTATSGLSSIPHSSSGGVSGNAFSNGCSDNGWPAHASYWQSSANFFPDVQAPERIPSAPMKQHISSETAPMYNAWSASAANEPRHNYNQTSEESNHACTANQQPGFWSPLKMPWVQGSHPLLRSKGHS